MQTVGVYEAKTHLTKLLEQVNKGECILITRHGVPIAVLQPPPHKKQMTPQKAVAQLREFRNMNRLNDLSLKKMIEEGRR